MTTSEQNKKIGIVGADKAAIELLELFANNQEIDILFVADPDVNAPAIARAKKMGIKTMSKPEVAIKNIKVDLVIEATGAQENMAMIADVVGVSGVVSAEIILFLYQVFGKQRGLANHQVFADLASVRQEIDRNTRDVSKTLHGIEKISNELEVLAINAGIQASRAGEFGKGFAVVAGEVKSTARVARDLAGDIDRVINEISSMSKKIDQSLKKVL